MRYYIAYGSNLNIRQMKSRCPHARPVGTAEIKDYRLLFKGSQSGAYLTVEKEKGHSVPVGIWEVDEMDERNLDRYEGFPAFYYKENLRLPVTDENGNTEEKNCFLWDSQAITTLLSAPQDMKTSALILLRYLKRMNTLLHT